MASIQKHLVVPALYTVLLLLLVNNSSMYGPIADMASIMMGVTVSVGLLVFGYSSARLKSMNRDLLWLLVTFGVFFVVYAVSAVNGHSFIRGMYRALLIVSVYGMLFLFYRWGRQGYALNIFSMISKMVVLLFIVYASVSMLQATYTGFSGFLTNPNGFGMWTALMTLILIAGFRRRGPISILGIVLGIYLVYISSSRTALGAVLIGLAVVVLPRRILGSRPFRIGMIPALILMSVAIIYLLAYSDLAHYNAIALDATGKSLLSGRERIWPIVIDEIQEKWLFGLGSSTNLSDISAYTFSVHNTFLQTALQSGVIGLAAMLGLLTFVHSLIHKTTDNVHFKVIYASFVAVVIIQNYEVTLFQNNLSLSYPFWAVFGLALGHRHYLSSVSNREHRISSSTSTQS